MIKVLFVCLGNICRSPMAEGLFTHHVKNAGLKGEIEIDSCGTGAWHMGELADPRMRETAQKHGIELTSRARQIKPEDFQEYDYILAMDDNNYQELKRIQDRVPDGKAKLYKMRDFDPESKGADVPDPYFGGQEGFEKVYEMLDRSTRKFLSVVYPRDL